MVKIAVIGTGYVGLVSGACLADFGNQVVCVDTDRNKIDLLDRGELPIYEPGLAEVVRRNVAAARLSFTMDSVSAVKEAEVVFIAVGTPPSDDGSADLSYVLGVAEMIADCIDGPIVVVDKSTVPVGTGRRVKSKIEEKLSSRGKTFGVDIVSNPEFLREGSAVQDFLHPDRVVIGSDSGHALALMKKVYRALYLRETPFVETSLETAEMIKYATNAFLAVKIAYINEVANLCEKVGANVQEVAAGMGRDGRINAKFLHPGPGYGGSCFPKDTRALVDIGRKFDRRLSVVEAAIASNDRQKLLMVEKIVATMGCVEGKTFAILGLSFKPNTDDMREAPSLAILHGLAEAGAMFRVFDPVAMKEAEWRLKAIRDKIVFCQNEYDAMQGADAAVIITEWNQFRNLDLNKMRQALSFPTLFDLRNVYSRADVESAGFTYVGVGQ